MTEKTSKKGLSLAGQNDLSIQLADGYETSLEVETMLQTLIDALGEENSGFMCRVIDLPPSLGPAAS